jgi:hypothetical protein
MREGVIVEEDKIKSKIKDQDIIWSRGNSILIWPNPTGQTEISA